MSARPPIQHALPAARPAAVPLASQGPALSLLMWSAWQRVGAAAVLVLALWLAVAWALGR
jgi:hypothetical protein